MRTKLDSYVLYIQQIFGKTLEYIKSCIQKIPIREKKISIVFSQIPLDDKFDIIRDIDHTPFTQFQCQACIYPAKSPH